MAHPLEQTESVRTYQRLLQGEIKNFPPVFFSPHARKRRLEQLTQYFIEEILKITPEAALETLTKDHFKQHKLECLLRYIDDFPEKNDERTVKALVRLAYPRLPQEPLKSLVISTYDEVLNGTRKTFPTNYFHGRLGEERAKICVQHLVEDILKISPQEAPTVITRELLAEYRLKILLNLFFDSTFDLLTTTYPFLTSKDFPT